MRRKEERSKQAKVKQTNKAKQQSTPKAVTFPKKNELPRVGLEHVHVLRDMNTRHLFAIMRTENRPLCEEVHVHCHYTAVIPTIQVYIVYGGFKLLQLLKSWLDSIIHLECVYTCTCTCMYIHLHMHMKQELMFTLYSSLPIKVPELQYTSRRVCVCVCVVCVCVCVCGVCGVCLYMYVTYDSRHSKVLVQEPISEVVSFKHHKVPVMCDLTPNGPAPCAQDRDALSNYSFLYNICTLYVHVHCICIYVHTSEDAFCSAESTAHLMVSWSKSLAGALPLFRLRARSSGPRSAPRLRV